MTGVWIVFAITVLIAVYSGITFFSNLNSKAKQKNANAKSVKKNNIYGIVFLVFLIIAIIELFVYIA
ncbi:Mid2-like cell wall stress sensor domain protein [Staphylococcus saprophyticus]|uniref:hypothetical protein n=1 Tax=Staphylococcus TaxID=1279 RepID=UPI000254ACC8|nr:MULTISPECIES: hypothetical protein [Staphylococcus]EHY92394.1 hypothetical protein SSME_14020 [Staphylococcus saprophyticus subsp. saprophyticus KACC 16562]MBF2751155.1 Mid2-like cell wall stress sensor domain protein [Staphylococcus saprophyticus]MBF2780540.1 Mid2-like cell wall stress sensor domain protein [Staphylococcus saprophyticus]MBN6093279.1 Mid2-like cell wall stress sensor domain protein [Staphylococcus saprophyticus]MBN6094524.1 Mid2-like cell wall stress sensor domain protein [